jgi:nitric oxide reductase large subunit
LVEGQAAGQPESPISEDRVSNILKWVLLATAILCFGLLAWATIKTYEKAPPFPDSFVDSSGAVVMTANDIIAGKGGFQKADLMDYGSIYGMGSYFGEDYTASTLVRLGALTKQSLSNSVALPPATKAPANQSLAVTGPATPAKPTTPPAASLTDALADAAATAQMQKDLQGIDLTQNQVILPMPVADAIRTVQGELTTKLSTENLSAGWVPAKSLDPVLRKQTADFIIYSAITTVARRPDKPNTSWTENWPFEPSVGNTPTTNTFHWTWISFCFTFFAMGFVLWLYRAYLDHPDDTPRERGLVHYRPLTPSQKKAGKYFVIVALLSWSILMFRALWPSRDTLAEATKQFWTGRIRLEHLIWAATINVAVLYIFGMIPLTGIEKSFTITDYWRWWVVHLWVEQSFEFFAVAMSAYLLMSLGLVSRKLAERSVYLELILIFLGGVLGTGHHLYWAGGPGMWVPLGSMFSFIEVLPLVLLILEAISQHRLIKGAAKFDYGLAYLYILGSAFSTFVGAGVFGGGTLNAPLVNYYEHGTFLTLNHAHTSLFGAFGLLALGLIYFCLRYRAGPDAAFDERPGRIAFWCYNGGVLLWIFLNFFPIGWPQLDAVYEHGFAWARSQKFYDQTLFWQWMRLPGDVVFSIGTLIMCWDFVAKLMRKPAPLAMPASA